MNVAELIALLEGCDQDGLVVISESGHTYRDPEVETRTVVANPVLAGLYHRPHGDLPTRTAVAVLGVTGEYMGEGGGE